MWGHYTKGHTGAVIEFESNNDNVFSVAREVVYLNEIPKLFKNTMDFAEFVAQGATLENMIKVYELSTLTKSSHWEYEKEWRIIDEFLKPNGHICHYTPLNSSDIRAIYIGCKTDTVQQQELLQYLKLNFPSAQPFKTVPNHERYALDFNPI